MTGVLHAVALGVMAGLWLLVLLMVAGAGCHVGTVVRVPSRRAQGPLGAGREIVRSRGDQRQANLARAAG